MALAVTEQFSKSFAKAGWRRKSHFHRRVYRNAESAASQQPPARPGENRNEPASGRGQPLCPRPLPMAFNRPAEARKLPENLMKS